MTTVCSGGGGAGGGGGGFGGDGSGAHIIRAVNTCAD